MAINWRAEAEFEGIFSQGCRISDLNGQIVLFSGTTCQVAGLKSYLGKDYDNLICVDVICHEGNFSEAEMQGAVGGMRAARSTAIYYGEQTPVSEGNVIAGDLGEKKYDPETIRKLLSRGLRPQDGWRYLKGMAVIRKRSFSILPEEWANRFSSESSTRKGERFRHQFLEHTGEIQHTPYGWTVGLDIPTIDEIRQEIKSLRESAV